MASSNRFSPLSMGESETTEAEQRSQLPTMKKSDTPKPVKLSPKTKRFLSSVPPAVGERVSRLVALQAEKRRQKEEYQKELQALERKYAAKSKPLYTERAKLVSDATGLQHGDNDLRHFLQSFCGPAVGLPHFWLAAMRRHPAISDLIQEWDDEPLSYLTDIKVEYLQPPLLGFRLLFEFAENDFFVNPVLSKTYTYEEGEDNAGLFYGEVRGEAILWRPGKELPPKALGHFPDQPPPESFFDFFNPPQLPPPDSQDEDIAQMQVAMDYAYGEVFKETIVPDAVDWFTGEAVMEDGDGT